MELGTAESYLIFIFCVSIQQSTWIVGGPSGRGSRNCRCCCSCCSTADGDPAGGRRRNAGGRAATCTSSERSGDFRPVLESTARLQPSSLQTGWWCVVIIISSRGQCCSASGSTLFLWRADGIVMSGVDRGRSCNFISKSSSSKTCRCSGSNR